jgi:hypothetical protein
MADLDFTELVSNSSLPGRPAHLRPIKDAKPVHPKEGVGSAVEQGLSEWIGSQGGVAPFMRDVINQWNVSASNPVAGPASQDSQRDNALIPKTYDAKVGDFNKSVNTSVRTGDLASIWKGLTENRPERQVDPNFDIMATLPKLADTYYEHMDTLRTAKSQAEVDDMTKRFDQERKDGGDIGSSFFGALVGGIIGNPIQMAVGAGEVKIAQSLWQAARLTRTGGLAATAAVSGISGGAQEALRQKMQYGAVDDRAAIGVMAGMNAAVMSGAAAYTTRSGTKLRSVIDKRAVDEQAAAQAKAPVEAAVAPPGEAGSAASTPETIAPQKTSRQRVAEAAAEIERPASDADYIEMRLTQAHLNFSHDTEEAVERVAGVQSIPQRNPDPMYPDWLEGHRNGETNAPSQDGMPSPISAAPAERVIIENAQQEQARIVMSKEKQTQWKQAIDWLGDHTTWFDSFGKAMKSKSDVVKSFMLRTAEDSTGILREHGTGTATAKGRMKKVFDSFTVPISDEHTAWIARKGHSFVDIQSGKASREFNAALRTELELRNNSKGMSKTEQAAYDAERAASTDPEIIRAADHWEAAHKYAADTWGGYDEVMKGSFGDSSRGYVSRYLDGEVLGHLAQNDAKQYAAMLKLHAQRTFEHINSGIDARNAAGEYKTVFRSQPLPGGGVNKIAEEVPYERITQKQAEGISKTMFENAVTRANGEAGSMIGLLPHDGRDELRRLMESKGFAESELDNLFAIIDASVGDAGRSNRGKGRMNIDIISPDEQTGASLLSIYDNNLPKIAARYGDEFSGRAALARVGMKNNAEIETWIKAAANNFATEEDISLMRFTVDQLLGKREARNRVVQAMDGWMRAAMLGQASFAQAAESATVAANVGIWGTIKIIPELAAAMRKLENGVKADHPLLKSLKPYIGEIGADHRLLRATRQMDNMHATDGAAAMTFDLALRYNKKANDVMSAFNQIHDFQTKLAVIGMSQKLVKMIRSGEMHPRLTDAGIHGEWVGRIKDQLEKHAEFVDGEIHDFHFDKWDDQHAVTQYVDSTHRVANQLVQGHLVGETSRFMEGDLGKIIVGFRTFPFVAMRKQLLRNLYMADSVTFMNFALGMSFAYMVVAAKANLNTIGMSDTKAKKYLHDRMSDKALFMAAGQYAGAMGPLFDILGAADNFASSHRKYDVGDSLPLLGYGERFVNTASGAMHSATGLGKKDDNLLKDGVRLVNGALPFAWLGNALSK